MIFGFLRLAAIGLAVLTVIYLLLSIYARSLRREALEKEFDEGDGEGDREAYISSGMEDYEHSLRKRLLILVIVVPSVLFVVLFWIHNFS